MAAKEAFSLAFDALGGPDNLARWARENETEFYRLYSRLIPIDLKADVTQTINVTDDIPPK